VLDPDWRSPMRDPAEVILIVVALCLVLIVVARVFAIYY
jgi:hypothetical protein